jgi:predicted transcriptional regulator
MKTLTITISDETARRLAETAAESRRPQEEVAAQAVEETFGPDWFDELDEQAQAAIVSGVAEADREEFASDNAVAEAFARFKR